MSPPISNKQGARGFTLIELLIVIGIIGILAAIVLVAVDPSKRLKQARNARRFAESNAILNAILNYTVDNRGTLPSEIASATATGQVLLIGSGTTTTALMSTACPNSTTGAGEPYYLADLGKNTSFVDAYISELPIDPRGSNGTTTYDASITGYYLKHTTSGRIEVGACNPESEDNVTTPQIKIKR